MIEYLPWLYRWFRGEVLPVPGKMIGIAFFTCLSIIPLISTEPYLLQILSLAAIFSIYTVSWDLLAGFTGQINLGHGLFFGVAAYAAALANIHFGLPPWVTISVGALTAVAVGLIVGIPALRLRGLYLGLVTLSFPIILTGLIFAFPRYTGGELGLFGLAPLSHSKIVDYYIVVLVFLCSTVVMWKFTDVGSRFVRTGVILRAIREDEIAARVSGVHTTKIKLLAFGVSGCFAGIAGGLYAHFLRIAGPSNLELMFSFQAIIWTIFGGISTIYGGIAGVYILYLGIEFIRLSGEIAEEIRFVFLALIVIFTLLFMPQGLTIWVRDRIEILCPRCKKINLRNRRFCRVCRAQLHLERNHPHEKKEHPDEISV